MCVVCELGLVLRGGAAPAPAPAPAAAAPAVDHRRHDSPGVISKVCLFFFFLFLFLGGENLTRLEASS